MATINRLEGYPFDFLPIDADQNDPIWKVRFMLVAEKLVFYRAKPKIIVYLTGANIRYVRKLFEAIHEKDSEKIQNARLKEIGDKKYIYSGKSTLIASLKIISFVNIYLRLEESFEQQAHPAWLFSQAYEIYYHNVEKPRSQTFPREKSLTIFDCWTLIQKIGKTRTRYMSTLELVPCPHCKQNRITVRGVESPTDCPFCGLILAPHSALECNSSAARLTA